MPIDFYFAADAALDFLFAADADIVFGDDSALPPLALAGSGLSPLTSTAFALAAPSPTVSPNTGFSVTRTAARALSGHRVVRDTAAGLADYADAFTLSNALSVLGVTVGAVAAGAVVTVQAEGDMTEPSWTWTPAAPVFCGPAGTLTQTYNATWAFSIVVGYAVTSTTIRIHLHDPIFH